MLCVPLNIRSFIRETNGDLARKSERRAEVSYLTSMVPRNFCMFASFVSSQLNSLQFLSQKKAAVKERRNFDERPRFGTVQSTIYTQGEEGLIAKPNDEEDEYGNEKRKIPDWERKLNNMS